MKWTRKYTLLFILGAFAAGALAYAVGFSAIFGGKLPIVKEAPDFTLTDLNGNTVQANSHAGKVVLMEFMFTNCPDICPATTFNMVQMQEELKKKSWFGNKVQFVAVTFDPATDTPEVLRNYAELMKMDMSGWSVLRGSEDETRQVTSDYGITVQKLNDGLFVHSVTSLTLIDAQQQIRKVYKMGEEMDIPQMLKDIETLVEEQTKK